MLTPAPIVTLPAQIDISAIAPGTVFSGDGQTYFLMASQKTMVNLSNGQSSPIPPSPFPVSPFATARVVFN